MDSEPRKPSPSLDVQVAVLAAEIVGLRRDVEEVRDTVERWIENAGRDRTALLVAVASGWMGLIAAAIAAVLHH